MVLRADLVHTAADADRVTPGDKAQWLNGSQLAAWLRNATQ